MTPLPQDVELQGLAPKLAILSSAATAAGAVAVRAAVRGPPVPELRAGAFLAAEGREVRAFLGGAQEEAEAWWRRCGFSSGSIQGVLLLEKNAKKTNSGKQLHPFSPDPFFSELLSHHRSPRLPATPAAWRSSCPSPSHRCGHRPRPSRPSCRCGHRWRLRR